MERYLIDTNIISDYFASSLTSGGIKLMDTTIDATPILSVITQIELLCWKTSTQNENRVKDFINDSIVLNISPEVIDQCVSIRKELKIKIPDAIIAATALTNGLTLITNNVKDFQNITNLKIINPYSLS